MQLEQHLEMGMRHSLNAVRAAPTPPKDVVVEDGVRRLKGPADEAVQVEPFQEHPEERCGPRVASDEIQHLAAHL